MIHAERRRRAVAVARIGHALRRVRPDRDHRAAARAALPADRLELIRTLDDARLHALLQVRAPHDPPRLHAPDRPVVRRGGRADEPDPPGLARRTSCRSTIRCASPRRSARSTTCSTAASTSVSAEVSASRARAVGPRHHGGWTRTTRRRLPCYGPRSRRLADVSRRHVPLRRRADHAATVAARRRRRCGIPGTSYTRRRTA